MSLITLPAFLIRRREDTTPRPETTTTPQQADDGILMRFLTQGGATVIVTGSGRYGAEDCRWKCLGCGDTDRNRAVARYDWDARNKANDHATDCRAMSKPEA